MSVHDEISFKERDVSKFRIDKRMLPEEREKGSGMGSGNSGDGGETLGSKKYLYTNTV